MSIDMKKLLSMITSYRMNLLHDDEGPQTDFSSLLPFVLIIAYKFFFRQNEWAVIHHG